MTDIPVTDLGGGVMLPVVGFGTWQLSGRSAYESTRYALEVGYRHIDTATMYRNEREVAQAIRDSGVDRREVFITTKLPPGNAGRARETLADSLRALDTDYVDLWLVHWPPRTARGRASVWNALRELRDDGLVKAIGVSNYSLAEIDELIEDSGETPAVNQIQWGPSSYDPDIVVGHKARGIVLEGYSGLKDRKAKDPALAEIAAAHQVTVAQVVLRWQLEHGITVIPKSVHPERIAANFDLFGFALSEAEVARIDALGNI
jgi:diketogulonate reductase-like aldo/keto reductase